MTDNPFGIDRIKQSANFMEWNFTIFKDRTAWPVEEGMTQLLAHQGAEGFGPPLAAAMEDDAKLIHELGTRDTEAAVAVLRAFQAMSTVDTQRELARANADRLVQQGLPEPPWVDTIGRVRVDDCWWSHDEFGETAMIACAFSYDGEDAHAIFMLVDRALGGGMVRELLLTMNPDSYLAIVRKAEGGEECLVSEALDPALGRRLFEDAIATSDELSENKEYKIRPVPTSYRKMRALVLARARALADEPAPPMPGITTVEVELLKQSFLDSDAAADLPPVEPTIRAVDLLVDHFLDRAACHPIELGPRRVKVILEGSSLVDEVHGDPELRQVFADVACAWVHWTTTERNLSPAATDRLNQVARESSAALRPDAG
nr:hypothetical protein [Micromonospora sp. DSM 115978]